jgi:CRISPR/Cas system-associated endoribonuclease Cas2
VVNGYYDIGRPKRWHRVYRAKRGFVEWLRLPVFHCRPAREKLLRIQDSLCQIVSHSSDRLLIIGLGSTVTLELRVEGIGADLSAKVWSYFDFFCRTHASAQVI